MKAIFLISCLMIEGLVMGQPIKKLFVYAQENTPGIVPAENGGSGRHTKTEHFIYVTQSWLGSQIKFDRIRIEDKWYKIHAVDTMGTPVFLQYPEKKLLVARTDDLVLRLQIGEMFFSHVIMAPNKKQTSLYYIYRGKVYKISLKKIVKLAPMLGS